MPDTIDIKTVLVSVSDRTGLIEFCRALGDVRFIATGSTGSYLNQHGIVTTTVADITGFPEMLDGRVKTLHPKIHGGVLADRDKPDHLAQLEEHGIPRIDLVVVNLYPFREAVAEGKPWAEVIEKIDIGGPTLVRAAAKNHAGVAVVVNPERYRSLAEEVRSAGGLSAETRRGLAAEAFSHTAAYDAAISTWMHRERPFPERISVSLERVSELRYGENPHQAGALYAEEGAAAGALARAEQIQGKELSFNNYYDLDAALATVMEFDEPACVIVKHAVPCGVAIGADVTEAYERALAADRVSAFGGVVAFNRPMTEGAARASIDIHTECVIAPSFEEGALAALASKTGRRLLALGGEVPQERSFRRISGGFLIQDPDVAEDARAGMEVVTKVPPTEEQWRDLLFAWKVVKHTRSNAIVLAAEGVTVGIGAGQVSRVDAADIAARKAGDRAKGSVMASDAYFPFRDGLDAGAVAGVGAVIQPGGSRADKDVIAAANEHGIAMVLTGVRHFLHG